MNIKKNLINEKNTNNNNFYALKSVLLQEKDLHTQNMLLIF